jgi:acyl-homoserine-lactone acylase
VQNSNDSAWLTNPAQPLTGFPDIVSIAGTEQGGRTRYGLSMIRSRLAALDGLPGRKFTLAQLQQLSFANRSLYANVLLADLRAVCAAGTTAPSGADVSAPCAVLAAWDGTAEVTAVGWPLFDAWRGQMNAAGVNYWPRWPSPGWTSASPGAASRSRCAATSASRCMAATGPTSTTRSTTT